MSVDPSSSSSLLAKRISPRTLPAPTTELQKAGLRYERKVVRGLRIRGFDLEHNPWFEYWGGVCCPDVIVYELSCNRAIVVECKLRSTVMALAKLRNIYCPVVAQITGLKVFPLIITKHLDSVSFPDLVFNSSFYRAIEAQTPVYIWPGTGPIT